MLLIFLPRMRDRILEAIGDEVNINNAIKYNIQVFTAFYKEDSVTQICNLPRITTNNKRSFVV